MQRIRSLALPVAITVALASACQEAPLAPRTPARAPATTGQTQPRIKIFSGEAADSVSELLEPMWSRHDRSRPALSRLTWRRLNHVPTHIRDARSPRRGATAPNAILTSGGATATPQILSHYETFSWGWHTLSSSVPSGINAEMTFIGDDGEIDLANVTITPDNAGALVASSGIMAYGPGQIVNCADVTLSGCTNHHLSGVQTISGAADCNAHASGTISYWAAIVRSTLGFSWGPISLYTGSGLTTVSSSAPFSATAPVCTTQQSTTGGSTADSSGTSGTGTVGPPPAPTGPNVPTAPPPPTSSPSGAGGGFVCQQTDVYQIIGTTRTLFSTTIDCYPDQ